MVAEMTAPSGGTVNIPGVGPLKKRTVIIAGGGVLLVGGYSYYKKKKTASTAPITAAPNAINPATGFAFGSPEDAAALAAQGNYNVAANAGGSSMATPQPTVTGFTNNYQWSQAAQQYLVQNSGADGAIVGAALGKYIAGDVVNPSEKSIIQQAIAFEGQAPVAGANGFPPAIRDAPAIPTPGSPPSGRTPAQVANSVRLRAVYDNVVTHRKLAEAQYAKGPNPSNLTLLHNYQQQEKTAYDAYMASLR
jgi:hypothetical protein